MHVNLSVKQMNEDGLVQLVADVLAETKLAARKLVLEVTESIFILHYERHVKILNTLRAKGIGVALDDFRLRLFQPEPSAAPADRLGQDRP